MSVDVLAVAECCSRCGELTRSIVGFLVPPPLAEHPAGFIDFEAVAPLLVRRVTGAQLRRWGVGPIKTRRSRYRPEGYLSNGCISCDAIQGWFPVHESLTEFLSQGGTYEQLIVCCWHAEESELRRLREPESERLEECRAHAIDVSRGSPADADRGKVGSGPPASESPSRALQRTLRREAVRMGSFLRRMQAAGVEARSVKSAHRRALRGEH